MLQGKQFRSVGIQCQRSFVCYDRCKRLPEKDFTFFCGINQYVFEVLFDFLGGEEVCSKLKYSYSRKTPKQKQFQGDMTSKDKLFMTLLRLRRGIPLRDLGMIFNVSEGYASKCTYTWIRFMSLKFETLEECMFVSSKAQNGLRPRCFEKFENLVAIIDTTHYAIQRPYNFQQQTNTFSDYKSTNTMKVLIAISCFGGLSFISEGYEGSMSARKLLEECGFLNHLSVGDALMADRGFDIEDLCDDIGVDLLIPAFLGDRNNFTARELIMNRAIAESRIHVERFIGKMSEYRLIRFRLPNLLLPVASDIVKVCAFLVNFQRPFIKWDDDNNQ